MEKDIEKTEDKIRRVAKQIQDILVENKMAMIPTISIQEVKDKPVMEPEKPKIIKPGDDVLGMADFMK